MIRSLFKKMQAFKEEHLVKRLVQKWKCHAVCADGTEFDYTYPYWVCPSHLVHENALRWINNSLIKTGYFQVENKFYYTNSICFSDWEMVDEKMIEFLDDRYLYSVEFTEKEVNSLLTN